MAAAAAVAAASRPIWSDHGDAPFDDDAAPAKARHKKAAKPRRAKSGGAGSEFLDILKTIVYALLIALVLRILVFQPFTIPSASMEPNLYKGDYIVVSKWSYGYSKYSSGLPVNIPFIEGRVLGSSPKRGDIVVFKLPRDNKTDYIKRVIGLPGDKVQMIANKLYINDALVPDVQINSSDVVNSLSPRYAVRARETLPEGKSFVIQDFGPGNNLDDTAVFEVPEGHYFMMGDNRDNSIDSRVEMSQGVGLVPEENLIGKAEYMLFSWDEGASLFNPVSWFTKFRGDRFFKRLE